MAPLAWNEGLVVGVDSIDAAHRHLIDLLERAQAARAAGNTAAAARLLRDFLAAFTRHVDDENALLAGLGYREVARRRSEHLTAQSPVSVHPLTDDDDPEQVGQVADYCHAWLLDHLVRQDAPLRGFFAQRGLARRPRGPRWLRFDIVTVRWRIALLAAVPLVALSVLSLVAFDHMKQTARSMGLVHQLNEVNGQVGTLVHELQRERSLSTLYMSDRTASRQLLDEQIRRTDLAHGRFDVAAARVLDRLPPGPARERIESATQSLDIIPEIRGDVADRSFDAIQSMDIYTTAIDDLTAVVPDVVRIILPSEFSKNTFAYLLMLEAKERAGRERAVGVALLTPGSPQRFRNGDIKELAAEQRTLAESFAGLASPELAAAFSAAAEPGALRPMRKALENGETERYSAADWFEATSERMDRMAEVQAQMFAQLSADVEALQDDAVQRATWLGFGLAALVLVCFAMVAGLGWTVLPPLRRLGTTVRRLAEGERAFRVPGLAGRDELGDIARLVQLLQERLVQGDLLEARRWTENAERLRAVTDHLPGVVFRIVQPQAGGALLSCVSHKLRDITGLSPAEAVDMPVRSVLRRILLPQDRTAVFHALHRAGLRPVDMEFRLRPGPGGKVRWLRVLATPAHAEDGLVWDGVALDVSGLKRAEEERARIAAELNRVTQAHSTAQLADGIARDLDSLLQPIIGHGERIAAAIGPDQPAYGDVVAMLRATREAKLLGETIARIGGGEPPQPVDAVAVVARHLDALRPTLPANVVVDARLDGEGALVIAAEADIEQLTASLCTYGVGAMARTGGVLTVETSIADSQLVLKVGDSGRGLEKETLARVFSSRFATVAGESGDTLRLAMARAIIARCGGRLDAVTRPGRGTLFEVRLPVLAGRRDNVVELKGGIQWLRSR
ncbi:MAG: nitrate- and nitrite sensing domain-containing protein [Actinomycetota bacterium]